jgi:hypothetical protein
MATELEAINILLVARNLTPVTSTTSGHPDVQSAKALLTQHKRAVNSMPHWYNTEKDVDISPDPSGYLNVPPRTIALDNDSNYVIMAGKLYDPDTRTNVFTEAAEELTLIINRDWENLPIQAYDFIVALAKEEFIRHLESQVLTGQAEKDINRKKAIFDITDLRYKDVGKENQNPLFIKWRQKMIQR